MKLEPFAEKWAGFGFHVIEVDGQNLDELDDAITFAKNNDTGKPVAVIAKTKKGAGIKAIEGNYLWHYGAMDEASYEAGKASLAQYHQARVARAEKEGK
jgi:transketolase